MSAFLCLFSRLGFFFFCGCCFFSFLLAKFNIVMLKIPLLEWGSINLNNWVLDESLGSNKFVISGIIDDIQDSGFLCNLFRSPCEVTSINSKSAILIVSTSSSDSSQLLWSNFGHSRLSCHLKLSFLLVDWHTTSGCSSFVTWISWDTHDFLINNKLRIRSY